MILVGFTHEMVRSGTNEAELARLPDFIPSSQTHERIGFHGYESEHAFVIVELREEVTPEKIVLFPAKVPVAGDESGVGFPSALSVEIDDSTDFLHPVRVASWEEAESGEAETLPFLSFQGNGASGRFVRISVTGFRAGSDDLEKRFFRLGEVVILAGGRNVALKCPVTASASFENPRRWEPMNVTDGYFWCLPLRGEKGSPSNGFHSLIHNAPVANGKVWIEIDLGSPTEIEEIHLVPSHPKEIAGSFGYGFPPRFVLSADVGAPTETEILRETDPPYPAVALPNPGAAQVTVETPGLVAQRIRVSCETLWRRGPMESKKGSDYLFSLSEIQVWKDGENIAEGKSVSSSDCHESDSWSGQAVVDGYSSRYKLLNWEEWIGQLERRVEIEEVLARELAQAEQRKARLRARIFYGSLVAAALAVLISVIVVLTLRSREEQRRDELRARIARDLHDEIGASLSHLAMQSDLVRQQLEPDEKSAPKLETISKTARETLDHMRDIIWLLAHHRGSWTDLSERLESIASRFLQGVDSNIVVSGNPPSGDPPIEWAREIVSFFKEALTNVRKHSGAKQIEVFLTWNGELMIEVSDDGVGFDPEEAVVGPGAGLSNFAARAEALNGELEILSSPGEGATVRMRIPLPGRTNRV